jgi:hypothetical protein
MVHAQELPSAQAPPADGEAQQWLRSNGVTLTSLVLIAAALWWKSDLLGHFYFRQDDYQWMDRALTSRFSWSYLMTLNEGHLVPGGYALTWAMVRVSLYDWTLASVITLVLLAASGLALLRLLRTLFGARPWILIPLLVYLFTPLTISALSGWVFTVQWLPLQLTMFMAMDAHVRHVRAARRAPAIVAAAWIVAGMVVEDQAFLVPFLLFAVTSGFLISGSWPRAALFALRRYALTWLLYGILAAGYLVLFLYQLTHGNEQPVKPGQTVGVLQLASNALRVSFVPGALGGPWRWFATVDFAYATETPVVTQLSWVVAAVIIVASLWYRRHAWRAWAILAAWLVVGDLLPVVVGRLGLISGALLGLDLHYLADSVGVLAICVGLAFWPVAGERDPYRAALPPAALRIGSACVLAVAFLAGSVWSGHTYLADTSSAPESSYIATATVALRQAPSDAVIVSMAAPSAVIDNAYFGSASYTQQVLGPLAPAGSRLRWTTSPSGQYRNLMVFDSLGRLKPVVVQGPVSLSAPDHRACYAVTSSGTRIPLTGNLYYWPWTMEFSYSGPATTLQVQYGRAVHAVTVSAGTDNVYVPATGSGSTVIISNITTTSKPTTGNTTPVGPPACVSRLTVGSIEPSPKAFPIPFYPVH